MVRTGIMAIVIASLVPAFTLAESNPEVVSVRPVFEFIKGGKLHDAWLQHEVYGKVFGEGEAGFVAFWSEVCKLNPTKPCRPPADRHVPIGTTYVLPDLPTTQVASITVTEKKSPTRAPEARIQPVEESMLANISGVKLTGGAFITLIALLIFPRKKACLAEVSKDATSQEEYRAALRIRQAETTAENEELKKFINSFSLAYTLPDDMQTTEGDPTVHFKRTFLKGEPAVMIGSEVVLEKRIRRHLNRLHRQSPDALRAVGIEKVVPTTSLELAIA